ncbi:MAG: hypothetical protein ABIG44_05815 [Planctomycetota bacterium]
MRSNLTCKYSRRLNLLLVFLLLGLPSAAGQTGLLYRFEVGDELVYERRIQSLNSGTNELIRRDVQQIRIWCLARTVSEAFLLFEITPVDDGTPLPPRAVLMYVDQYGRRRIPDSMQLLADELEIAFELVPVQRLTMQAVAAWITPANIFGQQRRCTLAGPDDKHDRHTRVDYKIEYPPPLGSVLGYQGSGRYWYDTQAGLVTRCEASRQDKLSNTTTQSVALLRRQTRQTQEWIRRRVAETQIYLQSVQRERRLCQDILTQPEQVDRILERLGRLWSGRGGDFDAKSGSPYERLARAHRHYLSERVTELRSMAKYAQQTLNHPAPPWSLQDIAGTAVASEEMRGDVTIECLWSCHERHFWATLAALRDLRPQLKGTPIRVICLNVDTDAYQATRVIAGLPAGQTHVLAGPLLTINNPARLPVLRVLDKQGVVRHLWTGWRPSYTPILSPALDLIE